VLDLAFRADPARREPVYRQLADHLAELVATRRLRSGERLPPSRELAAGLGLSRNTVNRALGSLVEQGVLEAHVGRGTFVRRAPPRARDAGTGAGPARRPFAWRSLVSVRARLLPPPPAPRAAGSEPARVDFRPGRVDPEALPLAELVGAWQRAVARHLRESANTIDPLGHAPLRAAIARALAGRGITCRAEDVLVTVGAQQALDLVARALVDPGDAVAVEQPGWFGAAWAFRAAGADCLGVGVDAEGLRVEELARVVRARRPKLVYVTPAVQLPTGVPLSEARREALLELADHEQLPVVEDDYDSELRLGGPAAPALKTLDRGEQVVYLGTFSKALFPGLRVGYVVAAPALLERLAGLRGAASLGPSLVDQLALVEILSGDTFTRHVRRVRKRNAERACSMAGALAESMPAGTRFREPAGGTAFFVELPAQVDPVALAAAARERGIAYAPGEAFRLDGAGPPALVLSFAHAAPDAIRAGVAELGALVRRLAGAPRRSRGGVR
jgi:GntR family transcriptional regulator/MocR family aminotransferase